MTEILLGPVLTNAATLKVTDKASGKIYYKKHILPEGKFTYNGKELDLGPKVHKAALDSFKNKAFDEVTFQIPDEKGSHNTDPDKRRGTLANVEYVPGMGSYGYFDLTADMAAHVEKYPKFGVSPRLFLDHTRMDGQKFPVAYQHVLGTDVPRASGMDEWSKIELSEDLKKSVIYDFSSQLVESPPLGSIPTDGGIVTVVPPTNKEGEKVEVDKDMLSFLIQLKKDQDEIQKLAGGGVEVTKIPETISLSLNTHAQEIAALKAQNVKSEWASRKQSLLAAGVPPHQIDLATPIMERSDSTVIDLSTPEGNVASTDKTQVLGILESLKGTVDFSETGHGLSSNEADQISDDDIAGFIAHFNI